LLLIIVFGAWFWYDQTHQVQPKENPPPSNNLIAKVFYQCNDQKTIEASYYKGAPAPLPQPGEPPQPTGSIILVLSDGRQMTLPQTISGSGIRYANKDESFVFFSKGNTALVLENNQQDQTYTGCIEQ
jgi:membrane-bound inhibitor of C-type lysozyme